MTSRVIKITPRQSGPYSPYKNLVDFDIPSGQYDLSRSYFNLNVSLPSQSQGNITLMNLARNNTILQDNTAFVRNVSMKSQTKGTIENNRHINVLRANQKVYEESVSKALSSEIISKTATMLDVNGIGGSPYRQIQKIGDVNSKDIDHDHIIRMKDLMNFCKNDYYDTDDKGDLMLHLELNTEGFTSVQQLPTSAPIWTQKYGKVNSANLPAIGDMKDLSAAGTVTVLNTKTPFINIDQSPFYVGQALTISATGLNPSGAGGVPAGTQIATITVIEKNTNDNTLALSMSAGLVFSAATTSDIKVVSLTDDSPQPAVFNSCELVLVQVDKQASVDYEYTTYSLQEDSVSTESLNKNYFLSPMTKNVFIVCPENNGELSSNVVIGNYRTSINNVYQQNRPVQFGFPRDPLHLTQVMKTYDNSDTPLKNTAGMFYDYESLPDNIYGGDSGLSSYMVMVPTEVTQQPKLFGLELNSDGVNINHVYIFEEQIKQF